MCDVLMIGDERNMWVTRISNTIWYWTESIGKVIVWPRSGM